MKTLTPILRYLMSNWKLTVGLIVLTLLILFGVIGPLFVGEDQLQLGAGGFTKPPSADHPLGTDTSGRDMLALMIYGTPVTLRIGLVAGLAATLAGVFLGLTSGYIGGLFDELVRSAADVMMTIPAIAVLVVISSFTRDMSVELMGVIIAVFAWPYTTRAIRAQTLSMREHGFVRMARISGQNDFEIIIKELMPNLLPYIAAGFVSAVSSGVLASVTLQLLGLGPLSKPSVALVLNLAFNYAALLRQLWWMWMPPTFILIVLFIGLFLTSMGMDEIANPRLKGARAK